VPEGKKAFINLSFSSQKLNLIAEGEHKTNRRADSPFRINRSGKTSVSYVWKRISGLVFLCGTEYKWRDEVERMLT
jgi:hypothetical protein